MPVSLSVAPRMPAVGTLQDVDKKTTQPAVTTREKKVAQNHHEIFSFPLNMPKGIRLNSAKSPVYSSFWGFDLLVDTPPWGGGVPSGISGIKGKIAEISGIKDLSRNSRINDWGLQNQAF